MSLSRKAISLALAWSALASMPASVEPLPGPQQPTRHVVERSDLEAALARSAEEEVADRAAIRRVLRHPEVRRIAETLGLDITGADVAVSGLEGEELSRLAAGAELIGGELAGGQIISMRTTTLIIILLVVILLILVL